MNNIGKFGCGRSSGSGYMFTEAGTGNGDGLFFVSGFCSKRGTGYGLTSRWYSDKGTGNTVGHTGFNYSGCGTGSGVRTGSGTGKGDGYGYGESYLYSEHDGAGTGRDYSNGNELFIV
jgi:hypothetical protein